MTLFGGRRPAKPTPAQAVALEIYAALDRLFASKVPDGAWFSPPVCCRGDTPPDIAGCIAAGWMERRDNAEYGVQYRITDAGRAALGGGAS